MTLKNSLKTALKSLNDHKSRSALTILGIVVGITAIILIMSMGKGAESLILNELRGMGAETIVIRPGKEPRGPMDIAQTLFGDSLKQREVEALRRKQNVPKLVEVTPAVLVPGGVSYQGETYNRSFILGWSAEAMSRMLNLYPERGRLYSKSEIRQKASVAIIGRGVAEELFGGEDPLGKQITIKNKKFRVIGVYPSRGQVAFFNVDDVVMIPETTAQTYLLGIDHYHEIITRAESAADVKRTVLDIEITLRELHGITDPKDDDFFIVTQEGAIEQISTIINTFTIFLSLVVAVALVVGGIGVMNIMLVSVTERTREIGLRKALGATKRDIRTQFLLEAIILTGLGGVIGILLGGILSFVASIILTQVLELNWSFVLPISAMLLGIGVSSGVGLIFGIYPASQAAKKSPIDALRYE